MHTYKEERDESGQKEDRLRIILIPPKQCSNCAHCAQQGKRGKQKVAQQIDCKQKI